MKRLAFLFVLCSFVICGNRTFARVDDLHYFQEINKALMDRDVPKAEKIMARWEQENPNNPDLFIAKAIIDENSPSPSLEKQSAFYEKAISLRPDRLDYPMHYVEGLVAVGEIDRALKIIDRLLKDSNDDKVVWTIDSDTVKAEDKKDALLSAILPAENSLLNQSDFGNVSRFIDGIAALTNDTNLIVNIKYNRFINARDNHAYDQALKDAKYIADNINRDQKLWFLQNAAYLSLYTGENDSVIAIARRVIDAPDVTLDMKKSMEDLIKDLQKPHKPMKIESFLTYQLPYLASILKPTRESIEMLNHPNRVVMYMRGSFKTFDHEIPQIESDVYSMDGIPVIVWTLPKADFFSNKYVAFAPYDGHFRFFALKGEPGDGENGWTYEIVPKKDNDDKFVFYDTEDGADMTPGEFARKVAVLIETGANILFREQSK